MRRIAGSMGFMEKILIYMNGPVKSVMAYPL
jgi:hypothetical protein